MFYLFIFCVWLLQGGRRSDGRSPDEIRPINSKCGLLPRAHGSALFTRGETQVLNFIIQHTWLSCVPKLLFWLMLLPLPCIFRTHEDSYLFCMYVLVCVCVWHMLVCVLSISPWFVSPKHLVPSMELHCLHIVCWWL